MTRNSKTNSLATQAYQQVRKSILRGKLNPGEALSENRLAEELGMSRTPVREALQILARDGIVEMVPTRGYFVPRWSMDDVRELFELRESLEGMACRCAASRATDVEIEEFERLCGEYERAEDWEAWAQTGTEFHNRIFAAARNSRLVNFLESLKSQIILTRQSGLRKVPGRRDEAIQEHRAILNAIKARDPDQAEQQARAHVRLSHEATLRSFHSGL